MVDWNVMLILEQRTHALKVELDMEPLAYEFAVEEPNLNNEQQSWVDLE